MSETFSAKRDLVLKALLPGSAAYHVALAPACDYYPCPPEEDAMHKDREKATRHPVLSSEDARRG